MILSPLKSLVTTLFSVIGFCSFSQSFVFIEKYYPDGTLQEKYMVIVENGDSIKKGNYSFYYPEGIIMQEGFFIENLPDRKSTRLNSSHT